MSADLNWMIIRNNSAFLMKRRNIKKPFSTEKFNLKKLNSFRYNGLIHKKSVAIVEPSNKVGFRVLTKRVRCQARPGKAVVRTTMKSGPRRSLYKLQRLIKGQKYRCDLKMLALQRASALLRSQKRTKRIEARKQKNSKSKKAE